MAYGGPPRNTIPILGQPRLPKVVLALPSYSGWRINSSAVLNAMRSPFPIKSVEVVSSLLAHGFNKAWALALNERSSGITHFAMLHADVQPLPEDWLSRMIREMDRYRAGVLSVSLPIKNPRGLTSTALDLGDNWRVQRLMQKEIQARPETWTDPTLLINTGLMLVDFTQPWVEDFAFTINDRIIKNAYGKWEAEVESEDWYFSRFLHKHGISVYVTRTIAALHSGEHAWSNQGTWGDEIDPTLAESLRRTSQPTVLESNPRNEGKEG